jgi:hypothetical protein
MFQTRGRLVHLLGLGCLLAVLVARKSVGGLGLLGPPWGFEVGSANQPENTR